MQNEATEHQKQTLRQYAHELNMNEEEKNDLTEIMLRNDVSWNNMTEQQADRIITAFTGFYTIQNTLL